MYGNTIFNKYALDDAIVITSNRFTKKGLSGIKDILTTEFFTGFFGKKKNLVSGGRYRPLSVVTFAVEYEFFGKNPHISHFFNIILYILTGYLLFLVLSQIFPVKENFLLSIPFLATILWFFHPLHTEAVANIKGRDEIMSLLFSLLAFYYFFKSFESKKITYLSVAAISLFLGLMSKETAIAFVFVIPFAKWLFDNVKVKDLILPVSVLLLSTVIYLAIRFSVVGLPTNQIPAELMNNPFLHAATTQKFATIIYTFIVYFKLLLFPHPLTYDYYPYHIHLTGFANIWVILSIAVNLFLIVYAVVVIKKNKTLSFAIIFFYSTFFLVSNLLFPVGVFMNERFMFIPSVGFAIALSYFLIKIKNEKIFKGVLFVILALYSVKTISRNFDWYDDYTLFTHDVKISYDSAKSTTSAGGVIIDKAKTIPDPVKKHNMFLTAKKYLKKAITIHPRYVDALLLLGNAYYEDGRKIDSTWVYYKKIIKINPFYDKVYSNLHVMFEYEKDTMNVDNKISVAKDILKNKYVPVKEKAYFAHKAGNFYGRFKNMIDSSIYFLNFSYKLDSTTGSLYKDLGVAYGIAGKIDSSVYFTKKAIEYNPNDIGLYYNLGVTYYTAAVNAEKSRNKALAKTYLSEANKYFAIYKQKKQGQAGQ